MTEDDIRKAWDWVAGYLDRPRPRWFPGAWCAAMLLRHLQLSSDAYKRAVCEQIDVHVQQKYTLTLENERLSTRIEELEQNNRDLRVKVAAFRAVQLAEDHWSDLPVRRADERLRATINFPEHGNGD